MSFHYYHGLPTDLRADLLALYQVCKEKDPLTLAPFLETEDEESLLTCVYDRNGRLDAYFTVLTGPAEDGWEIRAFTRPECRHHGLFYQLLDAFEDALTEDPAMELPDFYYFYSDGTSPDTEGFATHTECEQLDSEQFLSLNVPAFRLRAAASSALPKITAVPCSEAVVLADLHCRCFDWEPDTSHAYAQTSLDAPDCQGYLLQNGAGTLGCFFLQENAGAACLFGFGLLPEFRGCGLARAALTAVVSALSAACHQLDVQVSTSNAPAYGLYRTTGFEVRAKLDIYELAL